MRYSRVLQATAITAALVVTLAGCSDSGTDTVDDIKADPIESTEGDRFTYYDTGEVEYAYHADGSSSKYRLDGTLELEFDADDNLTYYAYDGKQIERISYADGTSENFEVYPQFPHGTYIDATTGTLKNPASNDVAFNFTKRDLDTNEVFGEGTGHFLGIYPFEPSGDSVTGTCYAVFIDFQLDSYEATEYYDEVWAWEPSVGVVRNGERLSSYDLEDFEDLNDGCWGSELTEGKWEGLNAPVETGTTYYIAQTIYVPAGQEIDAIVIGNVYSDANVFAHYAPVVLDAPPAS